MSRYIDADKIKYHYHYITSALHQDGIAFKKDIEAMPDEDVAPIKHAHWCESDLNSEADGVFLKFAFSCSACGWEEVTNHNKPSFKFCPDCGAKMDEG